MDIYPAIDLKGGKCVRLRQGDFDAVTNYGDDPLVVARRWQAEGAKWLHIVDLDGARLGQTSAENTAAVRAIAAETGLPIQLGGGIRSADVARRMLMLGVARVVVGTAAARDAKLAAELFEEFGEQMAVGVDARDGMVAVQGWQEHSGENALLFVQRMANLGAKRFIFTDIARDGMLEGVNLSSLAQVAAAVPRVPVIASGGVADIGDIAALLEVARQSAPNVEGVIIGKALYANRILLPEVMAKVAESAN